MRQHSKLAKNVPLEFNQLFSGFEKRDRFAPLPLMFCPFFAVLLSPVLDGFDQQY